MKNKKNALYFSVLFALLALSACSTAEEPTESVATPASSVSDVAYTDDFPFSLITKDETEVTFTGVPQRVISANVNTGEQLMAMGLGDFIIGTANNNDEVTLEYREDYEAIPVISEKAPSMEVVLELNPDFIYGRGSAFGDKGIAQHATFTDYNIMSLSSIESYKQGADVEDVYQDFYSLGKIFQVEDRAEEIVSGMKTKIAEVENILDGVEPVKVFVYDFGSETGVYTCGNNFTSKLISRAGGVNIFASMEKTWDTVSWEAIIEANPDVIVINNYGSISLETKINELKTNPSLAGVTAIENENFVVISLLEVFASSQTAETIEFFAKSFHPEKFS